MAPSAATPTKVLLVEGSSDKHVIEHLRLQSLPSLSFDIKNCQSIEQLLRSVPVEVKAPGRIVVGILADANADPVGRWQEIRKAFEKANISILPGPIVDGMVLQGSPKVGVWLMPDNASEGELEDFLKTLIPESDRVWPLAQNYIGSIPLEIQPRKLSKAEVHAWLAGKPTLHPPGIAMDRSEGYFHTDVPLVVSLRCWLNELYG